MNGGAGCVVWWGADGLLCQQFASVAEAELFAVSCDGWAVVVTGTADDFCAGISVCGDYMSGMFGGRV